MTEWSETEKAFWILEHGEPDYAWIFERNGDIVYRRPFAAPGSKLPPWVSTEREEVTNKIVGKQIDLIILDEINTMTKEEVLTYFASHKSYRLMAYYFIDKTFNDEVEPTFVALLESKFARQSKVLQDFENICNLMEQESIAIATDFMEVLAFNTSLPKRSYTSIDMAAFAVEVKYNVFPDNGFGYTLKPLMLSNEDDDLFDSKNKTIGQIKNIIQDYDKKNITKEIKNSSEFRESFENIIFFIKKYIQKMMRKN